MGGEDEVTFAQKVSDNWNGFKKFMWDGEARTFMGRSGRSWAKIGVFYFIYYTCLALFWAAMLFIFLETIDYSRPKWTAYVSTPGLSYVPAHKENKIIFTQDNPATYEKITERLTKTYNSINETGQGSDCTDPQCSFDIGQLGQYCIPPNFGFDKGEPCLLVHLNRVYNWMPENYDEGEVPEEIQDVYEEGNIAFACEPYKEKYVKYYNETEVYPPQGISHAYFPYNPKKIGGKKNYATPWVAIRFKVEKNVLAKVSCRTYTKNIKPKKGLYDTDQESKFAVEFKINYEPKKDEL